MLAAPQPFSFVLFGASGHLAQIKIYPALYTLALKKKLPEQYAIIGYARSDMDDEAFRKLVHDSVKKDMGEVNEKVLSSMLEKTFYHQGQYDAPKDFAALAEKVKALEKGWRDPVRLSYLSVPPTVFPAVTKNLCDSGVHSQEMPFRSIIEKPVGHDLKSFKEVKKLLLQCFGEENTYLLDHYLGKEAVRNIYYLRYANPVLERLFKNTILHHIEITASEVAGLEGRAGYFEHTGTLRDMFQSHLLMMASLLTMHVQDGSDFRENRLDALKQFYLPTADVEEIVVQGQYGPGQIGKESVLGYTGEPGVVEQSRTNTYAALKLFTKSSRLQDVPFYLRSGKRMDKKETRISIQFQMPTEVGKGSTPNRLDIILQGEAGMRLHLQTKVGGTEPEFRPLVMEDPLVCMGECLPEHSMLLLEAIHGMRQWFLTFDEVETAWKLIDPVQTHLDKPDTPLHVYNAGNNGPGEAEEWIEKDSISWF